MHDYASFNSAHTAWLKCLTQAVWAELKLAKSCTKFYEKYISTYNWFAENKFGNSVEAISGNACQLGGPAVKYAKVSKSPAYANFSTP